MKRFILGAGAQKSGTTWLYEQFTRQDNFKPPATKELHVFDAIYLSDVLPFGDAIGQKMAERIQKAPKNYQSYFLTKRFQMFF
ncbi:hypothetical protein OAN307_c39940 [Octadecabacter antarcticus 307]|uniref:Sulfotransferase domain-containing protein n=1 Tax=Octadecabacter antarcticus 307 TaxID=391626 RepID=M9RB63_9RHOB|nr:hypothetical protein [Octadecabacter antarcticus]AGI69422.1 hypothetical protein OAN307_c39940 [Octadecabacter antarcticus 307]